ncbi:hypothetical protein PV08_01054 [Exophiala spinifera]|uniref:Transcription factor domain-containing protein n=1 Tax=Exophiala spinifera TaxID=91928 RepID=A0A0D2CA98_9EURO|nr:uncharacterized protein PV08_01054 [Exophiala spinifera]KIW20479.1 hypothetical protein PV08_01054 [Exophiala spinifera]
MCLYQNRFCRSEKQGCNPGGSSSTTTTTLSTDVVAQDDSDSRAGTAEYNGNLQTEESQDVSLSISAERTAAIPDSISLHTAETFPLVDADVLNFDFSFMAFDEDVEPLWPPDSPFPYFDPLCNLPSMSMNSELSASSRPTHNELMDGESDTSRGFSMEQSDPVEAKCAAICALLRKLDTSASEDDLERYSSREQVLQFHQLYGRHFQYHFPILHSPSHSLPSSSPILLLAIVLAGAHYSQPSNPGHRLLHFAVRLITHIEMEQVV